MPGKGVSGSKYFINLNYMIYKNYFHYLTYFCRTPVFCLGLGVDFTFASDNNDNNNDNYNNSHLNFPLLGKVKC